MTPEGIQPATVHIDRGTIVAVAGYEELPREAMPVELGKSVLMPAVVLRTVNERSVESLRRAAACGVGVWCGPGATVDGEGLPTQITRVVEPGDAWREQGPIEEWLPRLWTRFRNQGRPIEEVGETLCTAPAVALGIDGEKGAIAVGMDADFVVWDPEHAIEARGSQSLYGNVRKVILGGRDLPKR